LFITFEGIEGCGKSTQVKRLVKRLKKISIPVVHTLEPGGTKIGKDIREILLDSGNKNLSPLAELMLYCADRAQHMAEIIMPALERGDWVICDRFFDATTVYQGYARGLDPGLLNILKENVTAGVVPDITFLIDCPVEIGIARALKRNLSEAQSGQDRFEREKMAFHETVRQGYLALAGAEKDRFLVVDGTLEVGKLEESIFESLRPVVSKIGE